MYSTLEQFMILGACSLIGSYYDYLPEVLAHIIKKPKGIIVLNVI